MRSRTHAPQQLLTPTVAAGPAPKHHGRQRLIVLLGSVIAWFRAGYPDDAPGTGYSPLIALHGPVALTPRQIERAVDELLSAASDTTDIEVAITKTTDRLPTERQVRTVARALHRPPSRQPIDPNPTAQH